MLRFKITYLLIAALLICPYCCLGEEANDAVEKSLTAGCFCCDKPSDTDRKSPQTPVKEEHDCLCHGAIIGNSKVESFDGPFDLFVLAPSVLNANATCIAQISDVGISHACHFPPVVKGRDICVLTCALLL